MKKLALCFLAAIVIASFVAPAVRADTVGFSTPGGDFLSTGGGFTLGYTFSISTPIQLTKLGFYDYQADGLKTNVPVTVWNGAGQIVVSLTLASGVNTGEVDSYLYGALGSPISLSADTYTIGAYVVDQNDQVFYQGTVIPAAGVAYGDPRARVGNSYPTTNLFGNPNGYFGPNFQFVPEPSTWAMITLGSVGAGMVALRRRQASA